MKPAQLLGLDHLLTDDERDWSASCVQAASSWRSDVAHWYEQQNAPTRRILADMGAAGMLGIHIVAPGCPGRTAVQYGLAAAAVESVDSGLRSMLSVQGSLAMEAIAAFGSDEQREHYLPAMARGAIVGCFGLTEPNVGSNPAGMETRAERAGDRWRLNGVKRWATNGMVADVAIVWAQTDDGVRGFVVDMTLPGVERDAIAGKGSLRASDTAEITFRDVTVGDDALLPGARGLRGPLSCLHQARFGIVFGALGAAQDALETAVEYVTTREQFGKSLASFQLTQAKLADMTIDLGTAFAYAVHLGRIHDAGGAAPAQVSVGKINSTRTALRIVRECRTLLGGNGVLDEYGLMRHSANLESVLTYEGTVEMHQLVIGSSLTGTMAFA